MRGDKGKHLVEAVGYENVCFDGTSLLSLVWACKHWIAIPVGISISEVMARSTVSTVFHRGVYRYLSSRLVLSYISSCN